MSCWICGPNEQAGRLAELGCANPALAAALAELLRAASPISSSTSIASPVHRVVEASIDQKARGGPAADAAWRE
jgi:hypothetical protein